MSYRNTKSLFPTILAASILTFREASKDSASGGTATEDQEPLVDLTQFLADHPIVEVVDLELKKIVIDAGTQPRVSIDGDVVEEYAEIIRQSIKDEQPNPFDDLPDDKLPTVFRDPTGRCVLADGFHRHGGHKLARTKEMKVAVRDGSERDALLFSLSTNQEHGVRRTNKDKVRAVKTALKDPIWSKHSNSAIARFTGVSEFMVRDARKVIGEPTERIVTIRGRQTKMDTSGIGKGKGSKGTKAKAKAAAKAAKKSSKNGAKQIAGATVDDQTKGGFGDMHREVTKIKNMLGKSGDGFVKALEDGSLELNKKDIRDWAGFSEAKIRNIAPLVLGQDGCERMKPWKAHEFLTGGIPEKTVTFLHNLAIGSTGGVFTQKGEGVVITVEHKGK